MIGVSVVQGPEAPFASQTVMLSDNQTNIRSQFRGAVLGSAVADALAFPYQHYSRSFLRSLAGPLTKEYGQHHSGFYPTGQFSDDTQEMLAVLSAIIEKGEVDGETIAGHLIPLWRDSLLVERDGAADAAMGRLMKGQADWAHSGLEAGHAEVSPARRVVAIALWEHEDFDRLALAAEASTRITHRDPRVLASAAAVAAAIAHNVGTEELILGDFLDRVSDAAGKFDSNMQEAILDFPRTLSLPEFRTLWHFETLIADDRYPPNEQGLSEYCVPVTLTALYYFLKSPYHYEAVIENCLRAGGHIDTLAFLAGAMSGALLSDTTIPQNLIDGLFNSQDIGNRVDELYREWLKKTSVKSE